MAFTCFHCHLARKRQSEYPLYFAQSVHTACFNEGERFEDEVNLISLPNDLLLWVNYCISIQDTITTKKQDFHLASRWD